MKGIENKQQAIVSSDLISRQFEEIIVEYPEITDREHKGKPYYSIKYVEGGEKYIGYGTYKIDVLSSYIKDYFIPSAQPEPCEDAISRSEAIKVIEAIPDGNWKSIRYSKEIQRLPSVQPEPCEDAVSRHRLLSGLKELIDAWEKYPVMAEQIKGVETAIGYVKTIPSVTPKGEPMTNADKFKQIFGLYATELWSKTEVEFLAWLNSDFGQSDVPDISVGECKDAVSRKAISDWLKQYGQDVLHGKYKFSLVYIWKNLMELPPAQPEIIRCNDCKFSHMTVNGECKYCDIWFPDEKCYMDGDYFCGSAERRTDE